MIVTNCVSVTRIMRIVLMRISIGVVTPHCMFGPNPEKTTSCVWNALEFSLDFLCSGARSRKTPWATRSSSSASAKNGTTRLSGEVHLCPSLGSCGSIRSPAEGARRYVTFNSKKESMRYPSGMARFSPDPVSQGMQVRALVYQVPQSRSMKYYRGTALSVHLVRMPVGIEGLSSSRRVNWLPF